MAAERETLASKSPSEPSWISRTAHAIPVIALGMALSSFLVISFVLCVIGYLLFPALPINHAVLTLILPGSRLLDWWSVCLGLVESFAIGWFVALIFGPLYNYFALR